MALKQKTAPPCIDLMEHFGRSYKVEFEASYYANHNVKLRNGDPWLKIIPCQNGHIFPWGDDRLAASTSNRIGMKLLTVRGAELWQDGEDGKTVIFPMSSFKAIARVMRPRRKRQMTEEQKQQAAARLASFKFRSSNAVPEDSAASG